MVEAGYRWYVGVDWATESYQICLTDPGGGVIDGREVEHSGVAVAEFADWLARLKDSEPAQVAVAIEIPRGGLVETLVERGFHVFSINPKQLDRFRDRHTVAGAKDDRLDAFVLADSLRTDEHRFRRVELDDPAIIQIRELSRIDEDLRQETNRLQNRLREQLHRYFPQLLRLSPSAGEPWLWALLDAAPTPELARRLRRPRVQRLLREHRIRRFDAEDVVAALRSPALNVAPGTIEAARSHVELLLPRLRLVRAQRRDCAARIERLLEQLGTGEADDGEKREHRDVQILRSMPGIGRVVAATMLAEASHALRDRDYHALRAHAGVAPITRRSGKRTVVVMRQACNGRLRNALYHAARVHAQVDPRARAAYATLRARGHTHGRALRSVADRMLRILVAMLTDGTLYDHNHASKTRLEEAA